MAAVQKTENLGKPPATSVVAPRLAEGTSGPKLLDRLREAPRARHYSRRAKQTYCYWGRRFLCRSAYHDELNGQNSYNILACKDL
jgi:hypothetical protein